MARVPLTFELLDALKETLEHLENVRMSGPQDKLISDLKLSIHAHPTLSETIMEAAEVFFGQSTHLYHPKRNIKPHYLTTHGGGAVAAGGGAETAGAATGAAAGAGALRGIVTLTAVRQAGESLARLRCRHCRMPPRPTSPRSTSSATSSYGKRGYSRTGVA